MNKFLPLAFLIASHMALADDSALAQCDRLRSPLDSDSAAVIHFQPDAILPALRDACTQALKNDPDNPRLLYQTGVAHALLLMHEELAREPKTQDKPFFREYGLRQSARHYLQRAAAAGYFPARLALTDIGFSGSYEQSKAALEALLGDVSGKEAAAVHLQLGRWHDLQTHFERSNATQHRDAMHMHYQKAAALGNRDAQVALAMHDPDLAAGEKTLQDLAAQGHLLALQTLGIMQMTRHNREGLAKTIAELERLGKDNPDYRLAARYLEGMSSLNHGQNDADQAKGMQYLREAAAGGHGDAKALFRQMQAFPLPAQR